ncbi:precorrin-3B synthase [Phytohabitans rumicis]|uniref:Precorrin-3B synthase n=1 Tax=Phytohabitans rumicis TaxID=1076125 RepID=A0A6V8L663_9ACTN|nr:precorrin-3B synthase [Phytohabitans rumicis]
MHRAVDGGLARVRVPGGALTAAQWRALADATAELGDGGLELTSRANLQVRGLAAGAETALAARLSAAGLLPSVTHERVRNIVASPLSGRDGRGVLDVRSLVAALDRALCADPALAQLPGRFLFALDDGRGDVAGLGADVGLRGRTVLLAGQDSGLRVAPDEAVPVLLAAAHAFLALRGDHWRLSEIDDGAALVAARLGSGPAAAPPARPVAHGPIGVIPQADCRLAIAATAPLGRLDRAQIKVLCAAPGVVVTPWRSVVAVDLPDLGLLPALENAGLATDPGSSWVGVTACAGSTGCAKSATDVRADAIAHHSGQSSPPLPVHWVGCPRACGSPAADHVRMLATEDGYMETQP